MKKECTLTEQNILSDVQLINLNKIKPIEKVFPIHLEYIKKLIEEDGYINQPLIVDKRNYILLDGSHRYAYLKSCGYEFAPALLVDYNSSLITVGSNLVHRFISPENCIITKEKVIDYALNKKLFEPRTTRHFFPFRKEKYPISLNDLKKSKKTDIEYLTGKVNISEEILHNKKYLKEIDNELEEINKYIQEQLQTKQYINNQINNMCNFINKH